MIVLLENDAGADSLGRVREMLEQTGCTSCSWREQTRTVVGSVGSIPSPLRATLADQIARLPGVRQIADPMGPYPMAAASWNPGRTVVEIRPGLAVGGESLVVAAGPCSVEGREPLREAAELVRRSGAHVLRAGAYKPRTSPHSFQGLGREGLTCLKDVSDLTGLPIVTEIMDSRDLDLVEPVADILQIGSRNMQNYTLLKAVGQTRKPVLLKRGMCATVDEWLQAAEYVLCGGNPRVILCERGIRTFEPATRNTLDLNAIPLVKRLTHLPVIVDPSHGTGLRELVVPMALAAVAAGADGLLVEMHPTPEFALSDGRQSLSPDELGEMMRQVAAVAQAVGRRLPCS